MCITRPSSLRLALPLLVATAFTGGSMCTMNVLDASEPRTSPMMGLGCDALKLKAITSYTDAKERFLKDDHEAKRRDLFDNKVFYDCDTNSYWYWLDTLDRNGPKKWENASVDETGVTEFVHGYDGKTHLNGYREVRNPYYISVRERSQWYDNEKRAAASGVIELARSKVRSLSQKPGNTKLTSSKNKTRVQRQLALHPNESGDGAAP